MSRVLVLLLSFVALAVTNRGSAVAEEPQAKSRWPILRANFLADPPNVVAPTRGGTQLWGDEIVCGQWRIQRNVVTAHCRLLDPDDVRHAWGTLAVCLRHLDDLKKQGKIPPVRPAVVIVLHGLVGSRQQMSPLANYLQDRGNWSVVSITYPSTRASVADHAAALRAIVAHLDGVHEIHFVAHSLGNLVVRHYLADHAADHQGRIDPRIRRFVMLGPPNHGSELANTLGDNVIFDSTLGASAQQLAHRWRELEPHLATPPCEFGIIAGGKGNDLGFNPLLPGDDDGTVRVAETRLAGASDFTLVDSLHSSLMTNPIVQEQTQRYLRTGAFEAQGPRHPIRAND
ncbi:MAG TPA: alpha/beta fold hydrolase [Pirellulales bacterium]|jgi:pimeloyl-ACP methyl ester carboxylesterase